MRPGFQSFVAWRYLMARPKRLSRPVLALILACVLASAIAIGLGETLFRWFVSGRPKVNPFNEILGESSRLHEYDALGMWILRGIGVALVLGGALLARARESWVRTIGWGLIVAGLLSGTFGVVAHWLIGKQTFVEWVMWWGGIALAPLAVLLPLLVFRYFFTFFTTVSMFGVFIGSMALVVVLSIMGGFESDLRDKILGSNAHIRVTRLEGMMEDWQPALERVRGVRGVVAVTPYATTEVVLSASSNYTPVVIKGIDPETVVGVTELVKDIEGTPEEDQAAVRRLYPLREDDSGELEPEPDPGPEPDEPDEPTTDPAPTDMLEGDEVIDYSGSGDDDAAPDDDAPPPAEPATPETVDPAPDDFPDLEDEEPEDFSGGGGTIDIGDLMDPDFEPGILDAAPPEGRRIELLDGVLIGKELAKQLHLVPGTEVRLVSPLADPANPDATGTPIPFHRDYRIAGIFYTGMYEYDLQFVYVTLESLQEFLQLGDAIEGIEVRVRDPEVTEDTRAAIARALGPDYLVQDWKDLNRNLFSALNLEKIAMFLVLAIIILVASFSIIANLIMVVVEKGKEIALLKTLGASDTGVMRVFIMQGFFIGVVGTLAGVLEGLLVAVAARAKGVPINPDVYYIQELPIHIDPFSVAAIAAAGLLISAVATVYPATMAARLRPAIGLRHD